MCNKHVHSTVMRSSRFHCPISVINEPTTDELWISPVYRRLAVAKNARDRRQIYKTSDGGRKVFLLYDSLAKS